MTRTDPFSAVMGDRRGQTSPRSAVPSDTGPAAALTSCTAERPARETGVSGSSLPFQAVSRADAVAAVRACAQSLGHAPSISEYELWRHHYEPEHEDGTGSYIPPTFTTVRRRCGSWRDAIRLTTG